MHIYIYIYIYIYTLYIILIYTNANFLCVISKHIQNKNTIYLKPQIVKDKAMIDIYKASEKKINICEFICLFTMYKHVYLYIQKEKERERERERERKIKRERKKERK